MDELRKPAPRATRTSCLEDWRTRPPLKALPHRTRDDAGSVSSARASSHIRLHRCISSRRRSVRR